MKKKLPRIILLLVSLIFSVFYFFSFFGNSSLSLHGKVVVTVVEKEDADEVKESGSNESTSWLQDLNSSLGDFAADNATKFTENLNGYFDSAAVKPEDPYYDYPMAVYCMDVGQGSSMVVRVGDSYMLFDGGDWDAADALITKLDRLGITEFQYVFASHYDADHIAGIIRVLDRYTVNCIVAPDYVTDTETYRSFIELIEEKKIPVIYPYPEQQFQLDTAVMTCVAPCDDVYDNENDYSVGLHIVYGEFTVLVCGDATTVSEEEMLRYGQDLRSKVLIVNHHGSNSSTSLDFIQTVAPTLSIISCGSQNEYGHPAKEVLERIQAVGSLLLRTDQHGDIVITTDGINFHAYTEKPYDENILWQPGTSTCS